jgi:DNA polymerase-3 subunit gamma/tau
MAKKTLTTTAQWHELTELAGVTGLASQLAHHCALVDYRDGRVTLQLSPEAEPLRSPEIEERLRQALMAELGVAIRLEIRVQRHPAVTLH